MLEAVGREIDPEKSFGREQRGCPEAVTGQDLSGPFLFRLLPVKSSDL